jgi:glucose dehydrogenase
MNILKSVLACFAVATFSYTAMAATPKGEVKDAKTTDVVAAPTESNNATQATFTYYVTGISGSNYSLIDGSNPDPGCDLQESPCKITADHQITSGVAPMSQVDAQSNGYQVVSRQAQL